MLESPIDRPLLYFALIGKDKKVNEIYDFLEKSLKNHRLGHLSSSMSIREKYLRGYQEASGANSFGRHLLTELAKEAFNIQRDELEDSDMKNERDFYDPIIKDLKDKYPLEYNEAIGELRKIAHASQDYAREKGNVKGDTIVLYRNVPKGNKFEEDFLRGRKHKDEITYYPNILASFTNSESVKYDYGDDRSGLTIKRRVPIDDVLLHYGYFLNQGFNNEFADEQEVIVAHREEFVTLKKPEEYVIEK